MKITASCHNRKPMTRDCTAIGPSIENREVTSTHQGKSSDPQTNTRVKRVTRRDRSRVGPATKCRQESRDGRAAPGRPLSKSGRSPRGSMLLQGDSRSGMSHADTVTPPAGATRRDQPTMWSVINGRSDTPGRPSTFSRPQHRLNRKVTVQVTPTNEFKVPNLD